MNLLRKLALIMNIGWLAFFGFLAVTVRLSDDAIWSIIVGSITIVVNSAVLLRSTRAKAEGERTLFGLFLERHRLEQQRRIEELRGKS